MNVERMLALASEIETPTLRLEFDMRDFVEGSKSCFVPEPSEAGWVCGTAACIGGTAVFMFGKPGYFIGEEEATALLGLTYDQANRLFYNDDDYIVECPNSLYSITRQQAADAIRRMVAEEGGQ